MKKRSRLVRVNRARPVHPGPYSAILIDPAWPEVGGGKIKRGAQRHYQLFKKREQIYEAIVTFPVWRPAPNSHLYMWVTNTYLPWGLWLMDALGYKYKTNLPWTKQRMSLGQYFRGCHEMMLFGVKGDGYAACTLNEKGKRETVRSDYLVGATRPVDKGKAGKVGKPIHSAKPDATYRLVEARSIGPYLELFARPREGLQLGGNWLRYGMPGDGAAGPCVLGP